MNKEKISLTIQSIRRIKEEHDRLAIEIREKNIPEVTIPDDSKFLPLRKKLPKDMKWIRTKRRLVEEAVQQGNCVASYVREINADQCAIYSFTYEPEQQRYTVEFGFHPNNGYFIRQIESAYNQGHSKEAKEYVESFL